VRKLQHRWTEITPIRLFGAEGDDTEADSQEDAKNDDEGKDEKPVVEDKFSQDYVEGLRKEAAGHRVKGKEEAARADKAEAELAKIQKAEMTDLEAVKTDLETASTDLEEANATATAATSALRTERIVNAVTMAALEAGFEDPTDALSMISQDDLIDDEGNIVTKTVTTRLSALAKKKPYLLKSHRPGSGDGGGHGTPEDPTTFQSKRDAYLKEMTSTGGRIPST